MKKRNQKYYFLSKYLRETVEIYGDDGFDDDIEGPLFCGMNIVLIMPQMNIRLNGPTSTTKQLDVAINFSKKKGIIIKLNNKYEGGGKLQRMFDVSWLSSFKEEDERFTFSGNWGLQICDIINTVTNKNYEKYLKALWFLDMILSGNKLPKNKKYLTLSEIKIIITLISSSSVLLYDQYIMDTWNMFILSKKTLIINMHQIYERCPKILRHELFYKMQIRDSIRHKSNILKVKILNIFPNINKLIIYASCDYGLYRSYSFKIDLFIDLVLRQWNNQNKIKCIIAGRWAERYLKSWLFNSLSSVKIESEGFEISSIKSYKSPFNNSNYDVLTIESL